MKPKTKKQREIVELFQKLPAITERQREWAFANCSENKAFKSKNVAWCSECGGSFDVVGSELAVMLLGDKVICPHCGKKLKVEVSKKRKSGEKFYFTIVTTLKGYQVVRNFIVKKFVRKGEKPFQDIDEAVQLWIDENGHEEVIARPSKAILGCYDAWDFSKPMELRRRHTSGYWDYNPDKYLISGAWVYPKRNLLPKVKRNGYTGRNNYGIPESEHIKMLLTDPEAEWLEKTGQYSLFKLKYNRGIPERFRHAIHVANRARYKVKDASMWVDYLELLEYFHLDTHNAHYVCPRNLKAEHDRLDAKKKRIEAKRAAEKKKKEAAKDEAIYRADKQAFFGIRFGNDSIVVSVIQSVAALIEEGEAMHHCVASYRRKKESLILSARDREGKRIETVEVNLKTFKVVQSRAVCNGTSERHNEIVALVEKNMHLIRRAASAA